MCVKSAGVFEYREGYTTGAYRRWACRGLWKGFFDTSKNPFDIKHCGSYDSLKIRRRNKMLLKLNFGFEFQIAITWKTVRSALCELVKSIICVNHSVFYLSPRRR